MKLRSPKSFKSSQSAVLVMSSILGLFLMSGCDLESNNSNRVFVITKKESGEEGTFSFPEGRFQKVMAGTLERVHRSTLKNLDKQEPDPQFELSRVTVGLELEVEVGIKHFMDLAAEGAFELRFERLPFPKN